MKTLPEVLGGAAAALIIVVVAVLVLAAVALVTGIVLEAAIDQWAELLG